jgi:hypothetical protein
MRQRLIRNNLWRPKNRWLPVAFATTVITFILIVVIGFFINNSTSKIGKPEISISLLPKQKPDWQGYIKLQSGFSKLRQNWVAPGIKKPTGDNSHDYIQTEFERQITEIEHISSAEEDLKLTELNQAFQDYATKRRQESDLEFQKKSAIINDSLNREIQQRAGDINNQLQKYNRDLEMDQQLNLVNFQLQLAVLNLNTNPEDIGIKKSKIQAEILQIKQEISRKEALRKGFSSEQFLSYEKQRRDQVNAELDSLKDKLQTDMENDLTKNRAKLESEFHEWCERQDSEFAKAIKTRQDQKAK